MELETAVLVGVTVAHGQDARQQVDAVRLADLGLAAAVGGAKVAQRVLLLVAEGRRVRDVKARLEGEERVGARGRLVGRSVVDARELEAVARVGEQVDTEVRVARADDLAVLLSDLVHVRRRGGAEVPVGHLAAVVGLVEHAVQVMLTITKTYGIQEPTITLHVITFWSMSHDTININRTRE